MTDKVIRVNVTASKSQKVTVSSSKVANEITASPDTSAYYSRLAKNWAIAEGLVENIDYSSKHYAQESKASADMAKTYEISTQENYNMFMESSFNANNELQTNRDGALADIEGAKTSAIDSLNSIKDENISTIESKANEEIENLNKEIEQGKDEIKDTIDGIKVLTTLKIGQIGIAPLGIDETLNMERYLNGQIIIQDQFKGFTKFLKRRIELYPSLACTEDEWQTTVTMSAFSQCGKFVIDDNAGTIRLPKVVNIQGLTDLSKLGEIVEAGLPTISHTHTRGSMEISGTFTGGCGGAGGAFNKYGDTSGGQNGGGYKEALVDFYASRNWTGSTSTNSSVSSIYGKSTTVQQEQIQYPYFIQVATGAETEDNIINEIELNNPYSLLDVKWSDKLLNNISWLRSEGQANSKAIYNDVYDLILREYNSGVDETETVAGIAITYRRGSETNIKVTTNKTAYDSILSATGTAWYYVIDTANETFYLPQSDGFLQFGGSGEFVEAGLPNIEGKITMITALSRTSTGGAVYHETSTGETGGVASGSGFGTQGGCHYYIDASLSNPIYGNSNTVQPNAVKGYLYFYVGETVQNANLINAGRIEEKLVDKVDTNASNFTADGKSLISGFGMPSTKVVSLTVGASGTKYTAPANGWVRCWGYKNTAGNGYVQLYTSGGVATHGYVPQGWGCGNLTVPVRKGQQFFVQDYNDTSSAVLQFYYAQGEV